MNLLDSARRGAPARREGPRAYGPARHGESRGRGAAGIEAAGSGAGAGAGLGAGFVAHRVLPEVDAEAHHPQHLPPPPPPPPPMPPGTATGRSVRRGCRMSGAWHAEVGGNSRHRVEVTLRPAARRLSSPPRSWPRQKGAEETIGGNHPGGERMSGSDLRRELAEGEWDGAVLHTKSKQMLRNCRTIREHVHANHYAGSCQRSTCRPWA